MKRLITSMAVTAAFTVAGSAFAADPIIIKFSHVVATDTPKGQAAEYFKKLAEERTKGQVKVNIYPNSQLYKDKEELEALQMGSVQMLAPTTSKFGPMGLKEFEVFDLPYLFTNEEQVHKVTRGPVGQSLLKKLESKGIKGLAFWDNGFRVFSANKPIRSPEDIKGLKIRINSSKVNTAIVQSVGALPQTMALSEVYQALQTGVVDGADGNISNLYTQKQYEVQKYVADTRHSYSGYAVVVNKKFWDGLPADIRTTLEGAMKDASEYNDMMAEKDNAKAYAAIKASGKTQVYAPTPTEKAAWVKAMQPVQNDMASRIGPDIIKAVRTAVAK
ncbi:TRAP transporter substrate-binding protein [Pseudogulbenkiania sp. MAI-1]|uniref:TRAP transporter substrate-binding protein n=1 Tax=Pseudogulbenkiania sp. MAI-1 TaxID=990370 RepID=UPI00045E74A9|nr:TRAP transporter substrate-binding protein [Pseudogulbenkiania sp. MAI-1]